MISLSKILKKMSCNNEGKITVNFSLGTLVVMLVLGFSCCISWKTFNRPSKVKKSFWSSILVNFLHSENTQTDNHKGHYDRKYIHIQTVMLLNMHKNLENMHNRIDAET